MDTIYRGVDSINGKTYHLCRINARNLSSTLKENYDSLGKDFKKYDTIRSEDGDNLKEIYEYLNFSLLKLTDGKLILLDGFRRLLSYNPPDIDITVRIYDQEEFTEKELITLLIDYNQYKLIGDSGGNYFERGFYFLFDVVFNLNLIDNITFMRGYLEGYVDERSSSYDIDRLNGSKSYVKERLTNDFFIKDMIFISQLNIPFKNKVFFGKLLYSYRENGYKDDFNINLFETEINGNVGLATQINKYETYTLNDSRGKDALNEIKNLYKNIINGLTGGVRDITYAEKLAHYKELLETLKKDKSSYKISGRSDYRKISKYILSLDKSEYQLKGLVEPNQNNGVFYGLIDTFECYEGTHGRGIYIINNFLNIDLIFEGERYVLGHSGYSSFRGGTTKLWTKVRLPDSKRNDNIGSEVNISVYLSVNGKKRSEIEKIIKSL